MPLVKVHYYPTMFHEVDNLRIALGELVPAAMHTDMGQLTPGSIVFIAEPFGPSDSSNNTVFVDIEASYYEDRDNVEGRAKLIKVALNGIFPEPSFAVWAKLVNAGWAADNSDPDFDGDMSMQAAIDRATFLINEIRTTS